MIGHAAIEDATAAMKVSTNMPQNRATSRRCAEPAHASTVLASLALSTAACGRVRLASG